MKNAFMIGCLFVTQAAFAQARLKADTIDHLQPIGTFSKSVTFTPRVGQPIPQEYYTSAFGFFCRQELKMQQAHIPVVFRLGSMDYCNWLEQKPGYKTVVH